MAGAQHCVYHNKIVALHNDGLEAQPSSFRASKPHSSSLCKEWGRAIRTFGSKMNHSIIGVSKNTPNRKRVVSPNRSIKVDFNELRWWWSPSNDLLPFLFLNISLESFPSFPWPCSNFGNWWIYGFLIILLNLCSFFLVNKTLSPVKLRSLYSISFSPSIINGGWQGLKLTTFPSIRVILTSNQWSDHLAKSLRKSLS